MTRLSTLAQLTTGRIGLANTYYDVNILGDDDVGIRERIGNFSLEAGEIGVERVYESLSPVVAEKKQNITTVIYSLRLRKPTDVVLFAHHLLFIPCLESVSAGFSCIHTSATHRIKSKAKQRTTYR